MNHIFLFEQEKGYMYDLKIKESQQKKKENTNTNQKRKRTSVYAASMGLSSCRFVFVFFSLEPLQDQFIHSH